MSTILYILLAIVIFGVIIFVHEFGHFITAKLCKIKVNEFAMGMGPKLLSKKKGDTTYSLRLFPIGGFCAMEGEDEESDAEGSFTKAKVWKRILVVLAGAVMNLILGFVILICLTSTQDILASRTISQFEDNAVTYESGLREGDRILAINGRKLYLANDIFYELARVKDGTADVVVERDGEKLTLENVQFPTVEYEDGSSGISIDFYVYGVEKSFGSVMEYSARWTMALGRQIFLSVVDLVTGNVAINELSGPVGIVSAIGEAASVGWDYVFTLAALITINVGIFNLLPLPALDGGRLFLLLIEAVTRKKLPTKYEAVINIAGMVLLFGLMIFVTYQDVTRLFTR